MISMVKKLDWDSNFFNLKVGEIVVEEYKSTFDTASFDLLYVYGKKEFELIIHQFENTFSEVKVKYCKKIFTKNINSNNIFSIHDVKIDIQDLYQLAFESGKSSRFLLDNKFDDNKFKELYKAWIENSISKKIADDILVYIEKNELLGFVSYKISNEKASVGLIAVNPNHQGNKIGGKLLAKLENVLLDKNINEIIIPTQLANIQAFNFYKKQNYSIIETIYIKHYWKNDTF